MSLVVLFLAMSVAVALPQNFWTYPSGSSFPFSGRYLGGELRENQYPSSPAVFGRRLFRIPEYQPYDNFQANENEFSKHSTPVDLADDDQFVQPRKIASGQRFLFHPLLNQLLVPAQATSIATPSVSIQVVTVTASCITYDNFLQRPDYTTPCGAANRVARRKRSQIEDLDAKETIAPSAVEEVTPTHLPELERSPRNLLITSSKDEMERMDRQGRFGYFGFNNNPVLISVPNFVITQTQTTTVKLVLAGPANMGYLTCLPNGYAVC